MHLIYEYSNFKYFTNIKQEEQYLYSKSDFRENHALVMNTDYCWLPPLSALDFRCPDSKLSRLLSFIFKITIECKVPASNIWGTYIVI